MPIFRRRSQVQPSPAPSALPIAQDLEASGDLYALRAPVPHPCDSCGADEVSHKVIFEILSEDPDVPDLVFSIVICKSCANQVRRLAGVES